ncbi:uncharacterized protein LOC118408672 [Branchiostoma floridae]|uniref:Uncharacterized protein LOC118408672 n=1 Tax=Branchiostoma floridae TaxID=7739 RepID=A0A9J7HUA5_BRAFL|nr:uncharacterized protein LOC118408672 [Branchiostoma floridae]
MNDDDVGIVGVQTVTQQAPEAERRQADRPEAERQAKPKLTCVDQALFEQAVVGAGHVGEKPVEEMTDMLEGLTGPHMATLFCSGAGKNRLWPLPLSPLAAEEVARREGKLLVVAVALTPGLENTRLARFTSTEAFFRIIEDLQALYIHTLHTTEDGKECFGFSTL